MASFESLDANHHLNVRQIFDTWKALASSHNKMDMEAISSTPKSPTNERKLFDTITTTLDMKLLPGSSKEEVVSAASSVKNSMNAECLHTCSLTKSTVLENATLMNNVTIEK